jgi:hypothetical protein
MRHDEFEGICKSVSSGEETRVRHIVTHQIGKVIACSLEDEFFEVDAAGERKVWSKDNCKVLH